MSFSEINRLRKDGKLKEAYVLAKSEIKKAQESGDSEGILWGKRGMSWVLYDYMKKFTSKLEGNFDNSAFTNLLKVINNTSKLGLPKEEEMFYEQFTWKIGNALSHIDHERHPNIVKQIFSEIKEFDLSKSYEPYRYVLIQFHQALKNDPIYSDIVDWWDTDNFQPNDFEEKTNDDGKTYPSLAEQVYTNYYKHLVDRFNNGTISENEIELHLNKLNLVIEAKPEFKYLHYRRAQILQNIGKEEEALKAFLPYAKKNIKQTWVWELLGDLHSANHELKVSCYCKALSIPNKEDYVTNIRIKLAEQLINEKKYDEAKTEIEQYYNFRSQNGYKIVNKVNSWITMPWYHEAEKKESNTSLYKEYGKEANKIFVQDLPDSFIAVDYVNKGRKIVNFLQSRSYRGFFNYSEFDINPKIGEVYKVKMKPEGEEGYHIVYSMSKSEFVKADHLFDNFNGKISIHEGNNFGIIDGKDSIFVTGDQIKKYQLSDGDTVTCVAMANYDKKKKVWGWRLIKLTD